jgi:hypothetical protein
MSNFHLESRGILSVDELPPSPTGATFMNDTVARGQALSRQKNSFAVCRAGKLYDTEKWIAAGKPLDISAATKRGRQTTLLQIAVETGFHSLVELIVRRDTSQSSKPRSRSGRPPCEGRRQKVGPVANWLSSNTPINLGRFPGIRCSQNPGSRIASRAIAASAPAPTPTFIDEARGSLLRTACLPSPVRSS